MLDLSKHLMHSRVTVIFCFNVITHKMKFFSCKFNCGHMFRSTRLLADHRRDCGRCQRKTDRKRVCKFCDRVFPSKIDRLHHESACILLVVKGERDKRFESSSVAGVDEGAVDFQASS